MVRSNAALARPPATPRLTAPAAEGKFASLGRARRVWAVAAVHGEASRLARLHEMLLPRLLPGDRLVYLGNLLGRGAAVRRAVDEALAFRRAFLARRGAFAADLVFLRGAQEEMWQKLLQLQFASNPGEVLAWMLDRGVAMTIEAYGGDPRRGRVAVREGAMGLTRWTASLRAGLDAAPGHRQYLAALRRAAFTEAGLLFVHSGLVPGRALEQQGDALWWGGARFMELAGPYQDFARVIRGFDRNRPGLAETAHAVTLDAGSGFGGDLLAACFAASGEIVDRLAA